MSFKAFGNYLMAMRIEKKVSQEEIAEWLDVSQTTVHRFECGEVLPRYSQYVTLMEKFGEYADHSLAMLLDGNEMFGYNKLTELRIATRDGDLDTVRKLVREVENTSPFNSGIYLQYLRYATTLVDDMTSRQAIAELTAILRMTIKDFNVKNVAQYRLSNDEIVFIHELANRYEANGDKQKALDLLLSVKDSMDTYYVSEREKAGAYPIIMYNIALHYGKMGDHMKVLDYCEPARRMAIKYGKFRILPGLQYCIANVRYHQGDVDGCRELVAEAYYTARCMEQFVLANYIKKDAEEDFGITF